MRDDFDRLLEEELKDPEFQKEWNALDPEFNIIQAIVAARKNSHLAQKLVLTRQISANLKTAMQILLLPFYNDLLKEWICN